jgi:hypothetical protein
MRLLSTSFINNPGDSVELEEVFGSQIPPYAILSHTWGKEEVTFQDITSSPHPPCHKAGFSKIQGCCTKAAQDGYKYMLGKGFLPLLSHGSPRDNVLVLPE